MLYPDFNDLISYKYQKTGKMHSSHRKVSRAVPGNHPSLFHGRGLEFDAVREYVIGDDIRNIDWRVTARIGSPHLKVFKEEKQRHTLVCVDMNSTMRFGTRNTFKSVQAARCASFLGWRALSHQEHLSISLFGDVDSGVYSFTSKSTRQTMCALLKILSSPPLEQHEISLNLAFQSMEKISRPASVVYLISDFMDLSLNLAKEASFSYLNKNCDLVFIAINDIADQALIAAGMIGFCGQNKEKVYIDTESINQRQVYFAEWEKRCKALKTLTQNFKIPLIELSTESDICHDLLLGFKNRIKRKR